MHEELLKLKKKFHPKAILDIGANQGHFAIMCSHIWPFATLTLAEGNENCREDLRRLPYEFHICLLSDSAKEVVFYIDKSNAKSTGSSYYKENSVHFENAIEEKRITNTLDVLFQNRQFDFIKIDTQGSELDILRGGKEIAQKAEYILLEVSI
jgi:FkbM family methyltransferase